jgi:hypothetical protein
MEYKKTLNMTKSGFPMRAGLPKREPEMLRYWEQLDLYNELLKKNEGKPLFSLHDGPPFSNGALHMGHALNKALKDFSLPISMSFRLFGALLSGLLVSELVYYTISLSFVLPVLVGVLFTILHALIQTYVLTMLTANYYGEVSEPPKKKAKKEKKPAGAVPAVN